MVISSIVGFLLLLLVWYSTKQNRVKTPITLTQQYVSFVTRFNFLSIKKDSSNKITIFNSNYAVITVETKKSKTLIEIEGPMPGDNECVSLKVELPAKITAQQLVDGINQATAPYMQQYQALYEREINFVDLLEEEAKIQSLINLINYICAEYHELPKSIHHTDKESLKDMAESAKSIVADYVEMRDFILEYKTPLTTLIPIEAIGETWTLIDFLEHFFTRIETIKTSHENLATIMAPINQSEFVKAYKEQVLNQ